MVYKIMITEARIASIQDTGRNGLGYYGFSVSGALDQFAYQMGNAILSNSLNEPSIEITASNFRMTSTSRVSLSVTGAPSDVRVGEVKISQWKSFVLEPGQELSVVNINKGMRVYIAIAGGLKVPYIHGSASFDGELGIGKSLKKGDEIYLHNKGDLLRSNYELPEEHIPRYGAPWCINICEGPDSYIFEKHISLFQLIDFRVALDSNNVGIRLDKFKLTKFHPKQTLSRGVVPGAIEITPSGQPIILHRGRGGTIGYPVIACVTLTDLNIVGQLRPRDEVSFKLIKIEEAINMYILEKKLVESIKTESETLNENFKGEK